MIKLTLAQKQAYQQNGFLIINDFLTHDTCDQLMQRAHQLITDWQPDHLKTIFSTTNPQHEKNRYFLESNNKIHFFFEEEAMTAQGELKVDKQLAINKIGHALHELDPVFSTLNSLTQLTELTHDLGLLDTVALQSMYICKQPFIGGEVTCHQDATYLYSPQGNITGFWFALENATLENGCLWAIPGGHHAPLKSRLIRDTEDHLYTEYYDKSPWKLDDMIPLEVPRGSVIVLHSLLPHMSKENSSSRSRHAYTLHVMPKTDEFAQDNWLRQSSYS